MRKITHRKYDFFTRQHASVAQKTLQLTHIQSRIETKKKKHWKTTTIGRKHGLIGRSSLGMGNELTTFGHNNVRPLFTLVRVTTTTQNRRGGFLCGSQICVVHGSNSQINRGESCVGTSFDICVCAGDLIIGKGGRFVCCCGSKSNFRTMRVGNGAVCKVRLWKYDVKKYDCVSDDRLRDWVLNYFGIAGGVFQQNVH